MAVLCGIDFSGASRRAMTVASYLAARWKLPLEVAHVVDAPVTSKSPAAMQQIRDEAGTALEREAQRLRVGGQRTSTHLLFGRPDEAMLEYASTLDPKVIVIGALGVHAGQRWALGGSADHIAQASTAPVLVVRDDTPFLEWARGERPLRVVVGTDRTEVSACALSFVKQLRQLAPVDVTVAHLYWALQQEGRFGFKRDRGVLEADPRVEAVLREQVEREIGPLPGAGSTKVVVQLAYGAAADPIVELARAEDADLIVVGSHRRNLVNRLWRGSTSRAVLQAARCSVACVSAPHAGRERRPTPQVQRVLAATDLTSSGNSAVRWSFGIARAGGTVHLLHVRRPLARADLPVRDVFAPPGTEAGRAEVERLTQELEQLLAREGPFPEVSSEVAVLTSNDTAEAILQAAERLSVDVIVLGTQGRSALATALLGSVAQTVAMRSRRPVLLVHPEPG